MWRATASAWPISTSSTASTWRVGWRRNCSLSTCWPTSRRPTSCSCCSTRTRTSNASPRIRRRGWRRSLRWLRPRPKAELTRRRTRRVTAGWLSAAGQQHLAALDGGQHLLRRGAADMVAGVDRAFQGQYRKHILFDLIAELAQFIQAHLGQVLAIVDAVFHRMADDFVAVAERQALAHEVVSQVGGGGETA